MSDSDDDNIVRYGTQLEPYEEDRTSALPKTNTKLTNSRKKKLRKLLAANVNVNKACEVCHLSWPEICQLIPGIDHLSEANSSMGGRKRRKRNRPKVRVRSVEHLSRENEHNKIQFWGDDGVNTQTSHDCGKSPHNWEINMQSPALFESDINQESLEQPYRPPQTYTQEVLHTTHPNNGEEPGSAHDTAYETNRRKRSSSVGEPNWEPLYKVKKSSQVGFEEPNYWTRDRSPPRSRHDMALMDFRSNNSYERTQLKYNDTDTFQVKVHDGMRAVNRHCSDSSDVNPFSDHRHKAQQISSEGGASHKDWLEPDRPSRLGLRNETHPPARAHTYTDIDDKKLKDSKYKKNSWESSVKYLDRETDRPLRNELRVETQTTATICINDDSDEEYRGRTYKPHTRVDEGRGHFELSEPNRRETEYGEECHSRWDQRTENQTTFEDNVTNLEDVGPIRVAIRNVTPMTEKQMTAVLRDINHAIVRIGVQGAGPKFSGSTYKSGWILMNCENHMSQKWLEKEVPALKPWPEAKLSVTPPDDFSKPKQVSIFIPHKEGVKVSTALELLRVQNPELDTKNWEVLTVMKTISSQIVFLSVDNASFEALRRLNFKANLGTNKIDFWVEPEPIVRCDLVSPPPQDVPLASSSTYTEKESNSISRIGENTTTKVSRKVRRMLRRTHVVHGQPSANAKPSLLGHPFLMPSGPSLPQVNPSVSSSERRLALPQALPSQPGASYTPKKRWYPISDQSNPSSIGLRDEVPTKRKYQQAPDQFAVDEHGRRRFHGAFTGGFSAGFGNTVGSQEGWTPSTFKSSRVEKASFSNQRPEDFMDEEDRGEFGIAPRQVQTHHEFSGQKRPHRTQFHDGPIPGQPVLQQLVRAVHETAAVRMLRAMGWKEGQGTGERLSGKGKKKAREQHKVYGCYMPPELRQSEEEQNQEDEDDADSSDSDFDFDTLFAPDDYEPYILNRKNDRFGLGYSGLSRHSVLGNLTTEYGSEAGSSRSHLIMKDKGKRVSIRGQAFGVGAFENDDDDIYANEDMSHYDFSIGGPAPVSEKKKTVQKTGHVIQGFVKASKPLPSVPTYAPPALPRDYVPAVAGARRSRFEPTTQQPRDQGLGRHELTAKARGELLGEVPLPTPIQPPTPTEDPITKLLGKTVNFVTLTEKTVLDYIPITDSGKDLTRVFKPFTGNPEKQKRYERFVENKGVLERDGDVDKLQEWEREREMAEFEQAAKLYRPLTGVMGDRFTHASEPDEGTNTLTAVARSSTNHGLATKEQREAAQQGLYGVMTRQQTTWRPEAMLCRRFNVPEIGGARNEQKKEDRPKVSYSIFSYLESSVHDKDSFAKEQSKFSGSRSLTTNILPKTDQTGQKTDQVNQVDQNIDQNAKEIVQVSETTPGFNKRMTVAELFLKESEKTKNQGSEVTDTINKFDKMDLYKSIFLSDSEEEEDKDKSKNNEGTDFIDRPRNVERNTSPPRGIFANIDFDELNSWRRTDEPTKQPEDSAKKVDPLSKNSEDSSKKVESAKPNEKTNEDEAMYGPKIPENLQKRLQSETSGTNETIDVGSSSSEDSWVDVNEVKSKKLKKKKSKKHKAKHKSKKKSKSKKKDR